MYTPVTCPKCKSDIPNEELHSKIDCLNCGKEISL